jgi:predicted dehydrogenase
LAHDTIEVEDCASATLKFVDGMQGLIQGTTCTYRGHEARLEIHGTLGNVVVVGDQLMLWEVEGEEYIYVPDAGAIGGAADPVAGMAGEAVPAHVEQISDVIAAIAEDRDPLLSGREARRAVELILAIYESSATRKIVRLR